MRARNIKPGFYANDRLAECSFPARYIFPGLWMLADREGRLENRPRKIKGSVLPFDSLEVEPLLQELEDAEMIVRYEVNCVQVIGIVNFKKHQRPHAKEAASVLPPLPAKSYTETGKGAVEPGKGCCEHALNPSSLNPSSLNPSSLNPEGLKPESGKGLSRSGLGANDTEPSPVKVGEEPSAWLARIWMSRRRGAHTDHDRLSADNFADLLAAGISKEAITAEIERSDRPKTEPIWEFCGRLNPKVKNGKPKTDDGRLSQEYRGTATPV